MIALTSCYQGDSSGFRQPNNQLVEYGAALYLGQE